MLLHKQQISRMKITLKLLKRFCWKLNSPSYTYNHADNSALNEINDELKDYISYLRKINNHISLESNDLKKIYAELNSKTEDLSQQESEFKTYFLKNLPELQRYVARLEMVFEEETKLLSYIIDKMHEPQEQNKFLTRVDDSLKKLKESFSIIESIELLSTAFANKLKENEKLISEKIHLLKEEQTMDHHLRNNINSWLLD